MMHIVVEDCCYTAKIKNFSYQRLSLSLKNFPMKFLVCKVVNRRSIRQHVCTRGTSKLECFPISNFQNHKNLLVESFYCMVLLPLAIAIVTCSASCGLPTHVFVQYFTCDEAVCRQYTRGYIYTHVCYQLTWIQR